MRIGYSYWGFCESHEQSRIAQTPDGLRFCRPIFVEELISRGHEVIALQTQREENPTEGLKFNPTGLPDLDVVLFEWRWPTYKNFGPRRFEPDYSRQEQLLSHYHGKVPVVIWDLDLKLTAEDEKKWSQAIIADASLKPGALTRPRTVLTMWSDFGQLLPAAEATLEFGYVGNNYERQEMLEKYYATPSKDLREAGIQTKLWGNWLQSSPEREPPEAVIRKYPYMALNDRVGFYESMQVLNKFITVVHITKPLYAAQGHVPARYFESLAVRTPALIPGEHLYSDILGEKWAVSSPADVVDKVKYLKTCTAQDRYHIVLEQETAFRKVWDFTVGAAVEFFEDLQRNPKSALKNR